MLVLVHPHLKWDFRQFLYCLGKNMNTCNAYIVIILFLIILSLVLENGYFVKFVLYCCHLICWFPMQLRYIHCGSKISQPNIYIFLFKMKSHNINLNLPIKPFHYEMGQNMKLETSFPSFANSRATILHSLVTQLMDVLYSL